MARLPRLSLPGIAHYVLQRGHNGGAIVRDGDDSQHLLDALREAAANHRVALHGYAIGRDEWRAFATPAEAGAVSAMMQATGRRYAAWFNRRHGRSGALWDGRFRSALIEPGEPTLQVLREVDGWVGPAIDAGSDGAAPHRAPDGGVPAPWRSSRGQRSGGLRDASLVDPPEYWQLGNTPFERESAYRSLLEQPLDTATREQLARALLGAWAWGSAAFLRQVEQLSSRPASPRPRGRPRRN